VSSGRYLTTTLLLHRAPTARLSTRRSRTKSRFKGEAIRPSIIVADRASLKTVPQHDSRPTCLDWAAEQDSPAIRSRNFGGAIGNPAANSDALVAGPRLPLETSYNADSILRLARVSTRPPPASASTLRTWPPPLRGNAWSSSTSLERLAHLADDRRRPLPRSNRRSRPASTIGCPAHGEQVPGPCRTTVQHRRDESQPEMAITTSHGHILRRDLCTSWALDGACPVHVFHRFRNDALNFHPQYSASHHDGSEQPNGRTVTSRTSEQQSTCVAPRLARLGQRRRIGDGLLDVEAHLAGYPGDLTQQLWALAVSLDRRRDPPFELQVT